MSMSWSVGFEVVSPLYIVWIAPAVSDIAASASGVCWPLRGQPVSREAAALDYVTYPLVVR
eukprot:6003606-Prymnesium_polylepis.1